jgi:hypothetical protein
LLSASLYACATSPCRQRGWRQGPPAEWSHLPATATATGACRHWPRRHVPRVGPGVPPLIGGLF